MFAVPAQPTQPSNMVARWHLDPKPVILVNGLELVLWRSSQFDDSLTSGRPPCTILADLSVHRFVLMACGFPVWWSMARLQAQPIRKAEKSQMNF